MIIVCVTLTVNICKKGGVVTEELIGSLTTYGFCTSGFNRDHATQPGNPYQPTSDVDFTPPISKHWLNSQNINSIRPKTFQNSENASGKMHSNHLYH